MNSDAEERKSRQQNTILLGCIFSVVLLFLVATDVWYRVDSDLSGSSRILVTGPHSTAIHKKANILSSETVVPYCLYLNSIAGKKLKIEQFIAFNHTIDLNEASPAMLAILSGIGPSLAADIIAYRNRYGPFTSKSELLKIPGFGAKRYLTLNHLFTVSSHVHE